MYFKASHKIQPATQLKKDRSVTPEPMNKPFEKDLIMIKLNDLSSETEEGIASKLFTGVIKAFRFLVH